MAKTTIGFEDITLAGAIKIDFEPMMRDHFTTFELSLGNVIFGIGTFLDDPHIGPRTGVYWVFAEGGQIDARGFSVDDPQELELDFSLTAGGHYIERTVGVDPIMKPSEEGSSDAITHTVERYAKDIWETDIETGRIHLTFGDIALELVNSAAPPGSDPTDPEGPFFGLITPASVLGVMFTSCWWEMEEGVETAWLALSLSGIDYSFDEVFKPGPPGTSLYMRGQGNQLIWGSTGEKESKDKGVFTYISPPHIVDWSGYGLCDWGEAEHNPRYDDVLVWGGFHKSQAMDNFTWPLKEETQVGGSGEFDWGDPIPVRLGELRALGTYIQRVAPFADLQSNVAEFWPGPWSYLYVDTKSHMENRFYPKPGDHPLRLPYGIPHLLDPMPHVDPHFGIHVEHDDVSVNMPMGLTERPTHWQGTNFIALDNRTAPVTFKVPSDGGSLHRTFKRNWLPRCTALIEYGRKTGNWSVFPAGYQVRRANYMLELYGDWDWADIKDKTGYEEEEEDVGYFASHRYLLFALEGPQTADETEVMVKLTHHAENVSDDHTLDLTGESGMREVTVALGAPKVTEYTGRYDYGAKQLLIDLAEPYNAIPDLRHVSKLEIFFGEEHEGDWSLVDVTLKRDTDAITRVTMHEPRLGYVSGGLRGVVDGLYPWALCAPDNHNVYAGQEQLVELINWYKTVTLNLTQDGSAAWELEHFLGIVNGACEGWKWTLPDNWGAMLVDEDDRLMTYGYSFDIAERQDLIITDAEAASPEHPAYLGVSKLLARGMGGSVSDLPVYGYSTELTNRYPGRLGAYRWHTAAQLVYRPHGVVCVQGGIHGLGEQVQQAKAIPIYTKRADEDGSHWEVVYELGADIHGYWAVGSDIVAEYTGISPVYWQYRVGKTGSTIGRLYERQWVAEYFKRFKIGGVDAVRDPWGVIWEAFTLEGKVYVRRLNRQALSWGPNRLVVETGGDVGQPSISRNHLGLIYVSALVDDAISPTTWYSRDTGKTWEELPSDD